MIEGFYGPPWTHEERLDLIRFCGAHGLNTWVHAPKDDQYHRKLWREPYPDDELARSPSSSPRRSAATSSSSTRSRRASTSAADDESELEALEAKREHLRGAGIETFQLLWDDIEHA